MQNPKTQGVGLTQIVSICEDIGTEILTNI